MLTHQKVVELLLRFHFLLKNCNVDSARLCILTGSHQNLPHNHSSLGLLNFSRIPTHVGPCSRQDPLLLPRNNPAPLPLCGCWYVLFVETVRDEIQLTLDKNPQNCKEFFLSWIVSDDEVKKI